MLKHVLIPLDGSDLAEAAIADALNIIEPHGKITLISAVEMVNFPSYAYFPGAIPEEYESTSKDLLPFAKHYLERQAETLKQRGYQVNVVVEIGDPAQIITEAISRFHPEVVVMSTHARSGLSRWLLGSVTQKVLSAKLCPVLVVPATQVVRQTDSQAELKEAKVTV
jgi:nucleotide-binding universal stress UspA family protein